MSGLMPILNRLLRRGGQPKANLVKRRPVLERPAYAERHEGETFVVLGNGPSLRTHGDTVKALIRETEAVVLGGNHITPFLHPTYHAFTNRHRFLDYARTIDPSKSRVLLSPYFQKATINEYYGGPYEEIAYVADNEAAFGIEDGIILAGCRTVAVLLIAVAIVMGAERIYVAGLDGFRRLVEEGRADDLHFTPLTSAARSVDHARSVMAGNERFLDEIQAYLRAHGREPFSIVTPTAYERHYRPMP
jgi:hypothetical protein